MSRNKNSTASIAALAAELNADAQEAFAGLLKAIVAGQNADSLADLASDVKSSRRSRKAAVEKPTRRSRKAKSSDDDDDDDIADIDEDEGEKPARRKRGAKAAAEDKPTRSRRAKAVEPDEDDEDEDDEDVTLEEATRDAVVDFMSEVNVEPHPGGVRELKPIVESWGGDFDELVSEGADRREKAEFAGTFIAANEAAAKALAGFDEDDVNELAEELGVEPARSKKATIKAILVEINSGGTDDDEDEDDADEDDEDEDDDE